MSILEWGKWACLSGANGRALVESKSVLGGVNEHTAAAQNVCGHSKNKQRENR